MILRKLSPLFILTTCLVLLQPEVSGQDLVKTSEKASRNLLKWKNPLTSYSHIARPSIDSIKTDPLARTLTIYFQRTLSYYPFRENDLQIFEKSLKEALGRKFRSYSIKIYSNGYELSELVPNYFRSRNIPDQSRVTNTSANRKVLVRRNNFDYPSLGLSGKNIALWHSHGYYFEQELDRWEWQRARLFSTVEDISVMGYVLPYLAEMLENAGAYTLIPRERDTNLNEVIVDNDKSTGKSEVVLHLNEGSSESARGFQMKDTLFPGENPFRMGSALRIKNGQAEYIPDFPSGGDYAVYVSWPQNLSNTTEALFEIRHAGGNTKFTVNQTIGGGTWIYLGKFRFLNGKNALAGSVTVSNLKTDGYLGLDAIKFGGGMGNVARRPGSEILTRKRSVDESVAANTVELSDNSKYSWKTSNKPRYTEGARYFLQYAGMPDSSVYSPTLSRNDYNDDYLCRGLWVNHISSPVTGDKNIRKGLGIPVDMSLAFHTDAGVTPNDSVIGTLAIYSTSQGNRKFPDGVSRMASRDLSDIIQTQIIEDIRIKYDSDWTRRGLWDRPYSEAARPDVPSMLLELLSHQNMADMKYGLDPRFRFDVSRAIYKGILKYFAFNENREYAVLPLPVSHFSVYPDGAGKVLLSWKPVADPLEPTAVPHSFKVYTRKNNGGFDNGFIVKSNSVSIPVSRDTIYSFRVTAINNGGESSASEILAAAISSNNKGQVLIINCFDRVAGPSWFGNGNMAGIEWWKDRGVADKADITSTGDQYDFDRKSDWLDDDSPGWGASYADREGIPAPGNTFDYSALHGRSILNAGYSFYSSSDESFTDSVNNFGEFNAADFIFGEEKTDNSDYGKGQYAVYTPAFMEKCRAIANDGMPVFISGSYIGSELSVLKKDSVVLKFAEEVLQIAPRTGNAVNIGEIYPTDDAKAWFTGRMKFNTGYSDFVYAAEYPDAIEPKGQNAITALRYSQNNTSAAVAGTGKARCFIMGFPFETLISPEDRDLLMQNILNFLIIK